jgi:hypothetical protein
MKINMGIIKDKRKFKRKSEQTDPTRPEGIAKKTNINDFDIDDDTIKDQQNKK